MKIILTVITFILITGVFNSCTKEENFNEVPIVERQNNKELQPNERLVFSDDENSQEIYTVLGAIRNNPFTVTNINLAKNNLYGTSSPNMSSTHLYVKFLPSSEDHLTILEEWETDNLIAIFDFPIEYEVTSMGEYYIDPLVTDSLFTYQYTSIPLGVGIPDVHYEVIDNLYLDKSDVLLIAESYWLTDNQEEITENVLKEGLKQLQIDLYDEEVITALLIPEIPEGDCPSGYEWKLVIDDSQIGKVARPVYIWECVIITDSPPGGNPSLNDCDCPIPYYRNPAGCVKVEGDFVFPEPVQIASIKVKDDWFTSDITYTNTEGCWQVNENYSGKVWMWVRFKNNNVKVRDTEYFQSIRVIIDYVGKFNTPPYNNIYVEYSNNGNTIQNPNTRMYWGRSSNIKYNQYI